MDELSELADLKAAGVLTDEMLADDDIRGARSIYLAAELFSTVDVAAALESLLPGPARGSVAHDECRRRRGAEQHGHEDAERQGAPVAHPEPEVAEEEHQQPRRREGGDEKDDEQYQQTLDHGVPISQSCDRL